MLTRVLLPTNTPDTQYRQSAVSRLVSESLHLLGPLAGVAALLGGVVVHVALQICSGLSDSAAASAGQAESCSSGRRRLQRAVGGTACYGWPSPLGPLGACLCVRGAGRPPGAYIYVCVCVCLCAAPICVCVRVLRCSQNVDLSSHAETPELH